MRRMRKHVNTTIAMLDSTRAVGARVASIVAAATLFPASAQCGAPFQTDDPSVVAPGGVELLVFYQSTRAEDARTGVLAGFEGHFGIVEGLEIDVTAPLAFNQSQGHTSRGYGDTTLGLKYRLISESQTTPLVSLVPKLSVPTGSSARGLGNGGSQVLVAIAAQVSRERFQSYANAGYWINNAREGRNYTFVGWQLQGQVSERCAIGAELFHVGAQAVEQHASAGFNLGGSCAIDERNQFLVSGGRGFRNASETNRASMYVGFQTSF